ncbi:TonB-dependent receptor [Balneolaceae bacterium ANBcel3]|nr:TonB-dependent receptor [Balneolaceae bacterium ANBcel3]
MLSPRSFWLFLFLPGFLIPLIAVPAQASSLSLSIHETAPDTTSESGRGVVRGTITDATDNEPLPFATILVEGTNFGTSANEEGFYELRNIPPGRYNLRFSFVGYQARTFYEIQISRNRDIRLDVELEPDPDLLDEIVVRPSPFNRSIESPVSKRTIGTSEIERSPGGNRDISRVIQSLPGVASGVGGFRNDLIIRGGAPGENVFYLDGIEVPTINHFSTQGASGGPTGLINVDLIREVDFYTGAFPANRGNVLSSVMELRQRSGGERYGFTATVGASDLGLTGEGPIGDQADFIVSFRRSYLQFLFEILELPFLPTYNDFQYRVRYRPAPGHDITLIGLGALDDSRLNTSANETEQQQYLLGNLPEFEQWNYTQGVRYRNTGTNRETTVVLSRSKFFNRTFKYQDNNDSSRDFLILDYESTETENKVRIENESRLGSYRVMAGVNYEYAIYTNNTFNRISVPGMDAPQTIDFDSRLPLHVWGVFGQVGNHFFGRRLELSAGVRFDAANFSDQTNRLTDQFSPRVSLSWILAPGFRLNANTGIFYQLPPYTILGYRNNDGILENRDNGIRWIRSNHYVAGIEYLPRENLIFTLEGFLKQYSDYPFLLRDGVSLANMGSDFGVIGNEPASPDSRGRSYGVEFLAQQKLYKDFYGIFSYTLFWSEFKGADGEYAPSAWDNRHLVSLTAGKQFSGGWDIGLRWQFIGSAPYTPYDIERSSRQEVWEVNSQGLPDYTRLNEKRTSPFHQLDIRVDKRFFFERFSLTTYIDIQNVYAYNTRLQRYLNVRRDDLGNPIPAEPGYNPAFQPGREYYRTYELENRSGTVLPTIGLIFEW